MSEIKEQDYKDYSEYLQALLDNNTFNEVLKMYPQETKTSLKKMFREYGVEIKYEYRTPISNTLIPKDSPLNKYFKSGELAREYNELHEVCNETKWIETELKTRTDIKQAHERQLGLILAELTEIQKSVNKQIDHITYQKFIIDVISKLGNENYIGIIAEEQFGKYEVPEFFTENLLTDEVLLGYIQGKYGEQTAIQVAQILRKG